MSRNEIRRINDHTSDRLSEVSRPIYLARLDRISKGMAQQVLPFPNTNETQEQAVRELDAFNLNLESMRNARIKIAEYAMVMSIHNDPFDDVLMRQNDQITEGKLTLEEIRGNKPDMI